MIVKWAVGRAWVDTDVIAAEIGCSLSRARQLCAAGHIREALKIRPGNVGGKGKWFAPVPLVYEPPTRKTYEPGRRQQWEPLKPLSLAEFAERLGKPEAEAQQLCDDERVCYVFKDDDGEYRIPRPPIVDMDELALPRQEK